jgi:hypothetical protein
MHRESAGGGLWDLAAVEQLLPKLRDDLKRMEAEPQNPFPAYDFFVTAYHMYEWAGKGNKSIRKQLEREPLVRIAGEIATRAKHFYAADEKWVHLASMEDRMPGPLGPTPAAMRTQLRVIIKDPLPPEIHDHEVNAVVLARLLVDRWTRWVNERQ